MCSPSANSIVSHAARVGAITMTRPVDGSALRNSSRSGGSQCSWTVRVTRRAGARMTPVAAGGGPGAAPSGQSDQRRALALLLVRGREPVDRGLRAPRAVLPLLLHIVVAEE